MVQQHLAIAQVFAFHLALRTLEDPHVLIDRPRGPQSQLFDLVGVIWPQAVADDLVVQRQVLAVRARITLATTPSIQLPVNAGRVMHLGANDLQTADVRHLRSQFDVGTATGHVRGHRHFALPAGQRHDVGLLGDFVGIEHAVLDPGLP